MAEESFSILIVDDEPAFREIFGTKLKAEGFTVREAEDGEDALKKLKKEKPDLILLDVKMPKLSGIETLFRMRKDPELKNVRVVFLTNFGELEEEAASLDIKFAKELGAADFIRKSDDLDSIVSRIRQILTSGN